MRAVNLIPVDQRGGSTLGAGRSQGGAYLVLALLAGLALLAVVYGMARHQVSSRQAKAVALEAQVQRVQADANRLAPYASFVALRDQRTQAVSQLVNSRFDWAHAFHELGRVLPANVAISTLTGTIGVPGASASASSPAAASPASSAAGASSGSSTSAGSGSVASSTPPGSVPVFVLTGCAKDQSTVALTLDRLRLIDGVSTVTLQSSTKSAGTGSAAVSCPASYPVFSLQITFDALPASTAVSSAPASAPVASTSGAAAKRAKSAGGNQ
jgi:Tfp pilus assembly protein PilN